VRIGWGLEGSTTAQAETGSDEDFIRANTVLSAPPLLPELRLHLGGDPLELWRRTQERLGDQSPGMPFWAFAWAGGQALARYLLDTPEAVQGKRVLDLGAGSGVAGLAALRSGCIGVTATEIDPLAAVAIRLNAAANRLPSPEIREDVTFALEDFELVVAGDVCYEEPTASTLLGIMEAAATRGVEALTGDPERRFFPNDRFEALKTYELPVMEDLESRETSRTTVWRMRR